MKSKFNVITFLMCFSVSIFGSYIGNHFFDNEGNGLQTLSSSNETPTIVQKIDLNENVQNPNMNFASIYNKVIPSIVTVNNNASDGYSTGSGIIYSSDGYILTNAHVVDNADLIAISTYDGTAYTAKVISRNNTNDIAVLKVTAKNLKAATFANMDTINIGDPVAAIGTPLGTFTGSMTTGIVSGLHRQISVDDTNNYFIQTDAAINPGNSGGALVNSKGEVIGMNTAKIIEEEVENIGFAIPSDLLVTMAKGGLVKDPNSPTTTNTTTYSGGSSKIGIVVSEDPYGVYIQEVLPESAAEEAGLSVGDVILKFGKYNISNQESLAAAKSHYKTGDKIELIIKNEGKMFTITLTLR